MNQKILIKRSKRENAIPTPESLDYGEIAINYRDGEEQIFFKNDSDNVINFKSYNSISNEINSKVQKLMTNTELKFFCAEDVTVTINGESTTYPTNTLVDVFLKNTDEFIITPTTNKSIFSLYAWPGALNVFYEWLEGVTLFDGILFDMNDENMYTKWNQGNQGLYRVQYAQYKNCVFWSDNPYVSDVSKRPNYTLYYSSELPLCYSTIPENTFKSFYFAYNVTMDPNWSNPLYKESFAAATWATQVFSYYGLHSIGIFDMDSTEFNIKLPKDCRGLMFYAPNILNAGVFDAINVTNFGAKSGSWRDAFAYCYQLQNLYIKNLKVNLNVSWSPISQQSLEFILNEAINTSKITISLSPYTYYRLTDSNKNIASVKNINLELLTTNTTDDNRLSMLVNNGNGTSYLSNDGTYKELNIEKYHSIEINNGDFITSNNQCLIKEGDSYENIIDVKNNSYYLSSINVIMGDNDITNTSVSGNSITIENVNDSVIITVTCIIQSIFEYQYIIGDNYQQGINLYEYINKLYYDTPYDLYDIGINLNGNVIINGEFCNYTLYSNNEKVIISENNIKYHVNSDGLITIID